MGEKDDGLGLGLGLGLGTSNSSQSSLKLNLMASLASSQLPQNNQHQKGSWNELFQISADKNSEMRQFFRGIDMNQVPSAVDCDDENGVSSPNSTISSVSGKRSEREPVAEENEAERTSCSPGSDDEDGGGGTGDAGRKKLRLTKEQSFVLEETFKEHNTLNLKQKQSLAQRLNLRPRQVEVWFQNRRARTKLKQTEVDCEYLKRCCENLTEENRRLHKEVQELRALKLSPQFYRHMTPPTTLTMCPSCERVAVTSQSSSVAATSSLVPPTGPGRQIPGSNPQRAVPIKPWGATPISQIPFDASASQP